MDTISFAITTSAAGAYNGTIDIRTPKLLYAIEWTDGTIADGGTAVFSTRNDNTSVDTTILTLAAPNSDAWYYPRLVEHNNIGTALTTYNVPVVAGALKLAVTSGGSVTSATAVCYLLEA